MGSSSGGAVRELWAAINLGLPISVQTAVFVLQTDRFKRAQE